MSLQFGNSISDITVQYFDKMELNLLYEPLHIRVGMIQELNWVTLDSSVS